MVLVVPEGQRPHSWRSYGRGSGIENASDDHAVQEVSGNKAERERD
jgi:hypothetical protein